MGMSPYVSKSPIHVGSSIELGGREIQQDALVVVLDLFKTVTARLCISLVSLMAMVGAVIGPDILLSLGLSPYEALLENDSIDSYMSGTTAVVALLTGSTLHVSHVGDSRLVVVQCDNGIYSGIQVTRDHTCNVPSEFERVKSTGARIEQLQRGSIVDGPLRIFKGTLPYPGIVVTRSIGDAVAKRLGVLHTPEVCTIQLTDKDIYMVFATDGLWDALSVKDAADIVSKSPTVQCATIDLMSAGLKRLGELELDDNVTVVVVGLGEEARIGINAALFTMLNLNDPVSIPSSTPGGQTADALPGSTNGLTITEPVWKVLIYDKLGQDIISPLLHIGDLRERGVTVHMSIYSDRDPIADAPAIYFVEPTADNIKRISNDMSRQLYDSFNINFSSALPRPLLEDLATAAAATDTAGVITQIYDQYLNFVAEAVALKLESKMRDHLLDSRSNLFEEGVQLSRPVLVILDRSIDLGTLLSHTWTYSTLVHDVLDMKLNRISIMVDERGRPVRKNYDVDVQDPFWSKKCWKPFSPSCRFGYPLNLGTDMGKDVDAEINKYKQEVDQVTRSCGVSSLEEVDPNEYNSSAKTLSSAIKQLPELTLRKKTLDMHMNMATTLFKEIQERQLDAFFSMEEALSKLTKATIIEAIRDTKKSPQDKIRLFLLHYLSVDDISKDDLAEFEACLSEAGCSTTSITYVKQVRMYSKMTAITNTPAPAAPGNDIFGSFTSNFSRLTDTLQSTGVSNHFETLISGVKNLLPTRKELAVTRTVDAIMEGTTVGGTGVADDFLYLDPRSSRSGAAGKQQPKGRVAFQEAIVFVVGGGNYLEYQNLIDYTQRSNLTKKKIIYGSTELLTAKKFIEQLDTLGAKK
ncbi:hypothetical protein BSLG_005505 [Batrachochytrium salamandrivorans]|nr:hypothetical protein BSLG_005505 [Batrachochytrium salamandrivorans]